MPTWNEINQEIDGLNRPDACEAVRNKYLQKLSSKVGRPVIAYYSGYLQRKQPNGLIHVEASFTDNDMNGFMSAIHGLDYSRGLDLVLHTPGGDIEAGRGVVEYLYKMFGRNIRAIVPHCAMSVGTMVACATSSIAMAKHSCLGPTDPQINGIPAMGVLAEIDRGIQEIQKDARKQIVWQQVFGKYPPTLILNCERAVAATRTMVKDWLQAGMLAGETNPAEAATKCTSALMDYSGTSTHSHHFTIDHCKAIGLKVTEIEADQDFQEAVLSVHHSFVATFSRLPLLKIIQNSNNSTWTVQG
jgi:ATP-dependent protease ClpP protease subunit